MNKSDPNGHVAGAVAQGAKSLASMIGSFFSEVASLFGGAGTGRALASGAGSVLGSAASGGVTLAVSIVLTPTETGRDDQFCKNLCSESERQKGEAAKLGLADRSGTAATPPDPDDEDRQDPASTGPNSSSEIRSIVRNSASPYGKSGNAFNVKSEAELDSLWGRISSGSRATSAQSYGGQMRELADGTRIGLRDASTTGGKTIDVFPRGGANGYKIHVTPGG